MKFFDKATAEEQQKLSSLDSSRTAAARLQQDATKALGEYEASLRKKYGLGPFDRILRAKEIEGKAKEDAINDARKPVDWLKLGRFSTVSSQVKDAK
jgi:hypothetical protein